MLADSTDTSVPPRRHSYQLLVFRRELCLRTPARPVIVQVTEVPFGGGRLTLTCAPGDPAIRTASGQDRARFLRSGESAPVSGCPARTRRKLPAVREIHGPPRNENGTGRRRTRWPFATAVRAAALAAAATATLAAALALVTSPPAAARPGLLHRPSGDNCAYAGTTPPVHLPTDFPVPPGWHIPCTTPTPPPRPTPTPAPPPPRSTAPRPHPTHAPTRATAPRPSPPAPPVRRAPPPPPPPPPPPTPQPARPLVRPAPARPFHYTAARHQPTHGRSVVTRTLLITTPAVLAGVALRPRSRSTSRSTGRSSS
ncbi:hypothetical protein GCM10009864_35440 [Streptomyces lunalinharesii]|uniref:Uncharacterized protein n=1 Tax=Streptomyces lunalinharesii TaxID=333384 RepID=A0ABN3S1X0_9ACTN